MRIILLSGAAIAALTFSGAASAEPVFNRIASFPVASNLPKDKDPNSVTSSEIITASQDGNLLIYSDSPAGGIGFVDITDAAAPKAGGFMALDGEPTSVTSVAGKVLAGVNTSKSYVEPSGALAVIDIASRRVEARCDLGGQPDSVALSPAKDLLAVAIENERDEDLNKGALLQLPAGFLVLLPVKADGTVDCAAKKVVSMTGLTAIAPEDPEPEFVTINSKNEVAVTLQENNHIIVVDGKTGKVASHFSAGTVDLDNVDVEEEGALTFDGQLKAVPREPDAIKWLDDDRLVTANEGDWKGGSRGFTIFAKDGRVLYESGLTLEYEAALAGHYPEGRSGNKGVEPEGLEVATFNGQRYFFVLAERASVVGVYKDTGAAPEFVQLLPSGVSPEGAIAIPARGLLATANEADLVEDGLARSHVMLYRLEDGPAKYPMIHSVMQGDRPLGWAAMSGLVGDDKAPGMLYGVSDSVFSMQPSIFRIDATKSPAVITERIAVNRAGQPAQKLDIEGITTDGNGGFWLASEGRTDRVLPHALYRVDAKGRIRQEVPFPDALLANEIRYGLEGITRVGEGDAAVLWMAIQREWKDDPKGMVKLLTYTPKSKEWGAVHYPLDKAESGWVGLSEITARNGKLYIVERDNLIGDQAKIKRLYTVDLAGLTPAKIGEALPVVQKTLLRDLMGDLKSANNGYVLDKVEGFTIDASGTAFLITDNDGVDDSSGETVFLNMGKM